MEMKNRSWIALVFYCATTTLAAGLSLAIVFASATVIYSVAQPSSPGSSPEAGAPTRTFPGIITDAHCGAKHQFSDKSPAECTRICVKNGSQYVLVDGDKVYALHGDIVQLNQMSGIRVTVIGTLEGNRINIASMTVVGQ